jgi:hypothetical protein
MKPVPALLPLLLAACSVSTPRSEPWILPAAEPPAARVSGAVLAPVAGGAAAWAVQEESGEAWSERRNRIGLFSGMVFDSRHREGFNLGGEYEYRISELFGAGAIAEFVFGSVEKWTALAGTFWHISGPLTLVVGLGAESPAGSETLAVLRIGGAYDFEITETIIVQPQLMFDFKEGGPATVIGAFVGTLF